MSVSVDLIGRVSSVIPLSAVARKIRFGSTSKLVLVDSGVSLAASVTLTNVLHLVERVRRILLMIATVQAIRY